jgi:fatty acid desaturase
MFVQSVLMLGSMHAIQVNHLRHHQYCMAEEDIEAMSARMPWWRAMLLGPAFPLRLHLNAWAVGSVTQRKWIAAELIANVVWVVLVFVFFDVAWLKYHVIVMAIGQCWTSFFAVWTVHHDCETDEFMARTVRSRWKNWVTYSMFFHVEHHLFPRVPTCKLNQLAKRMDAVAPELVYKQVI